MQQLVRASFVLNVILGLDPPQSNGTGCQRLWSCDHRPMKSLKSYPGHCASSAPGFQLGRKNRWPRRCMIEFVGMVVNCVDGIVPPVSANCTNLAVAGSGSASLSNYLKMANTTKCSKDTVNSSCFHHHHSEFGATEALTHGPCVLTTLREPAGRLESGYRYIDMRKWKRTHKHTNSTVSRDVTYLKSTYDAKPFVNPLYGFFGIPQTAYLAGLTKGLCHKGLVQLHIICTESLTNELSDLSKDLDISPDVHFPANGRSEAQSEELAKRSRLEPKLRSWVNNELYPLDSLLHDTFCNGRGIYDRTTNTS